MLSIYHSTAISRLLALFTLALAVSGHVSSCPDVNPLAFWMMSGPTVKLSPTVESRTLELTVGDLPSCRQLGRGFNGRTRLVSLSGAAFTNDTPPAFLDPLPVDIAVIDAGDNATPLCFGWSVPPGYNVYTVAVTIGGATAVESYAPTARTSGGPLCAALPGNGSLAVITVCYARAAGVTFDTVAWDSWYDVAWNLTVAPALTTAILCQSPPGSGRFRSTHRVGAVADRLIPARRVVSGTFEVTGIRDAGAVSAWIVSAGATGAAIITPATVECVDPGWAGLVCGFNLSIDPTMTPVSAVAIARGRGGDLLDGIACESVGAELVQAVRASDYLLAWDGTALAAGMVDAFPTILGPFDVPGSIPSDSGNRTILADLSFPDDDMPHMTASTRLTLMITECQ